MTGLDASAKCHRERSAAISDLPATASKVRRVATLLATTGLDASDKCHRERSAATSDLPATASKVRRVAVLLATTYREAFRKMRLKITLFLVIGYISAKRAPAS
tara:strand:+ start:1785 stop:2096 length:312 start_codon:yes stop_codon:yes gene_type:complete